MFIFILTGVGDLEMHAEMLKRVVMMKDNNNSQWRTFKKFSTAP